MIKVKPPNFFYDEGLIKNLNNSESFNRNQEEQNNTINNYFDKYDKKEINFLKNNENTNLTEMHSNNTIQNINNISAENKINIINKKNENNAEENKNKNKPKASRLVQPIINEITDIYEFNLFDEFALYNKLFFAGKLDCVAVEWSKRMTLCAGTFQVKDDLPLIRLSEPLLKFRELKETKETLIHEMIHAWNYVEKHDLSDDPSGHGVNFKRKMIEINEKSEFKINVYHDFIDEVDYHRKHVWRCDGVCKSKPPYFGYVKRAMNRPPGKGDRWFAEHELTCGGKFTKISEPENYKIKKNKNKKTNMNNNINKNKIRSVSKDGEGETIDILKDQKKEKNSFEEKNIYADLDKFFNSKKNLENHYEIDISERIQNEKNNQNKDFYIIFDNKKDENNIVKKLINKQLAPKEDVSQENELKSKNTLDSFITKHTNKNKCDFDKISNMVGFANTIDINQLFNYIKNDNSTEPDKELTNKLFLEKTKIENKLKKIKDEKNQKKQMENFIKNNKKQKNDSSEIKNESNSKSLLDEKALKDSSNINLDLNNNLGQINKNKKPLNNIRDLNYLDEVTFNPLTTEKKNKKIKISYFNEKKDENKTSGKKENQSHIMTYFKN